MRIAREREHVVFPTQTVGPPPNNKTGGWQLDLCGASALRPQAVLARLLNFLLQHLQGGGAGSGGFSGDEYTSGRGNSRSGPPEPRSELELSLGLLGPDGKSEC
eukprot:10153129-Alexandrium_andersonii.AAC.1